MANIKYRDDAFTTIVGSVAAIDTGIVVASNTPFSSLISGGSDHFFVTLKKATSGAKETVKVTANPNTTWTIVRAQGYGESALTFATGDSVSLRVGANLLDGYPQDDDLSASTGAALIGIAAGGHLQTHVTAAQAHIATIISTAGAGAVGRTGGGTVQTALSRTPFMFATVAAAQAATDLVSGNTICLADRASSYWDLSSSGTANGYNVILLTASGLYATLRTDGVEVTSMMFGAVGDGDGAGGGTNDYAACQAAFDWMRALDGRVLYGDAGKIYRCDTGITCQRSAAGDNEYLCFVGRNCKFDYSNIVAAGTNMLVGATSLTYFAEQGGVFLGQFKILGCEVANTTTNTPVGDRAGLKLEYASRVLMIDVYSNWNKYGIHTAYTFPLVSIGGSCRNNFVGHYADDASNLQTWNSPTFNECRYGVVIHKTANYGTAKIDNIVYNSPWLESCLVPVHIDTGAGGGTPFVRKIKFNDGYYKGQTYDTFRMAMAWDFATPATRGADRSSQLVGMYIYDGSFRGDATSATSANLCFSSNNTVRNFHGRMAIEQSANSMINSPYASRLTYTGDDSQIATFIENTVYWDSEDYDDEASWTPAITFATAGNLSVAYTTAVGTRTRVGRLITLNFVIQTSTFTHTTASGDLRITGMPDAARTLTGMEWYGNSNVSGITKAGYGQFLPRIVSAGTYITMRASGTGVGTSAVGAADMPTGGTVYLQGQIIYEVD